MQGERWLRAYACLLLAVGALSAARFSDAGEMLQPAFDFGLACVGQAKPGTAYEYSMTIGAGLPNPSGQPQPPGPPIPIRVVVTAVKTAEDGAALVARVDKLKTKDDYARNGIYWLRLAQSKGKGKAIATMEDAFAAGIGGSSHGVPAILAGYPDFVTMPEGQSAVVHNWRAAPVSRWTQSLDAKTREVTVKVDYFGHAKEPDVESGAKMLYWVKDKEELVETVPMGQEAAPLLQPGVDEPRDDKGMPRHFNVVPVEVTQSEEQVWQPGALFPEKITRTTRNGWMVFQAKLVKVGQAPTEPVAPAEFPGGPQVPKPQTTPTDGTKQAH